MTARPDANGDGDGVAASSVREQPEADPTSRIPRQPRPAAPGSPSPPDDKTSSDAAMPAVNATPLSTKVGEDPPGPDAMADPESASGSKDTSSTKATSTKAASTKAASTKAASTMASASTASASTASGTKTSGTKAGAAVGALAVMADAKDGVTGGAMRAEPGDKPGGTTDVLASPKEARDQAKNKVEPEVERAPADWENFAPTPARTPGRVTRVAVRTGRVLGFVQHEWTLTILCGLALSVLINIRILLDPIHTLPQDTWDPSLIAYLIAWDGYALLHFPAQLWQINAFFPSADGLAYSDAFLGYAPFALFGTGVDAAILRYNIVFILAQALTAIGGYALVRQLGAARLAAAVAAVAMAMAPWRLGQAGHLQVLSTGGILLALAMLARGHGIRWRTRRSDLEESRPPKRPGWAIAGWLCATWQVSLGFGIGLVFIYVLLGATIVGLLWWAIRSRRLPSKALLAADLGGGIVFAGVCFLLAQPYLKVLDYYPAVARTDEWIALYSPPLRGFFTAPESSLLWGGIHAPSRALLSLPGEMALLPGFALYALAIAGLMFSIWRPAVRLALLAGVAVTIIVGLGTHGPAGGNAGYLALMHYLPGFDGLRTPGRLVIWTTLFLAVLAAGAVGALAARAAEVALRRGLPRPTTMARLALLLPLVLVLVEGLGTTPHEKVAAAPAAVATAQAPYLVLPSSELLDMHVMAWSTDRFADVLNGGSGLVPAEIAETRKQVQRFPDAASVSYLREQGVNTVVVLPDLAQGTPWESAATASIDDLGITRDLAADAVTFHLNP